MASLSAIIAVKSIIFGGSQTIEKRFGVKSLIEIPIIPHLKLECYMSEAAVAVFESC